MSQKSRFVGKVPHLHCTAFMFCSSVVEPKWVESGVTRRQNPFLTSIFYLSAAHQSESFVFSLYLWFNAYIGGVWEPALTSSRFTCGYVIFYVIIINRYYIIRKTCQITVDESGAGLFSDSALFNLLAYHTRSWLRPTLETRCGPVRCYLARIEVPGPQFLELQNTHWLLGERRVHMIMNVFLAQFHMKVGAMLLTTSIIGIIFSVSLVLLQVVQLKP